MRPTRTIGLPNWTIRTGATGWATWRPAGGHLANLARLDTGQRTGEIPALPVSAPGVERDLPVTPRTLVPAGGMRFKVPVVPGLTLELVLDSEGTATAIATSQAR